MCKYSVWKIRLIQQFNLPSLFNKWTHWLLVPLVNTLVQCPLNIKESSSSGNFEKRRPVNNDLLTFSRVFAHVNFSVVSTLTWHGPCTSLARDSRMMKSQWNRTIFLRANEIAPFSRDFPRERETLKKHCNLWLRWKRNSTETLTRSSSRVIICAKSVCSLQSAFYTADR